MATRTDEFKVKVSERSLGRDLPQRIGRLLWLPMVLMALMAFPVAFILGAINADLIADGGEAASTLEAFRHVVPGFMFLGFASVFAAISFAIGKILGEFRKGGGEVQETTGQQVQTMKRPWTAYVFLGGMMMAMMIILGAVIAHFIIAVEAADGAISAVDSEQAFLWLEGFRRIGVATYLVSIAFGLGTIITVLRFQARRVRELAAEAGGRQATA